MSPSIDIAFSKHLAEVFAGRDIEEHKNEKFHNHGTSTFRREPCEFQLIQTPEFRTQRLWYPPDETVNRTQHAKGNLHSYEDRNPNCTDSAWSAVSRLRTQRISSLHPHGSAAGTGGKVHGRTLCFALSDIHF